MTLPATPLSPGPAIHSLRQLLHRPPTSLEAGRWRWMVRQQLSGVRDLLLGDPGGPDAEWLAPRHGVALRERRTLLERLSVLGPRVLEAPDIEPVRLEALRLLSDVRHHLQRRNDLAWDDVEEELGGSD